MTIDDSMRGCQAAWRKPGDPLARLVLHALLQAPFRAGPREQARLGWHGMPRA